MTINFNENLQERIITHLPKNVGYDDMLSLQGISIEKLEDLFGFSLEETNGCDMDWSSSFTYEGGNYEIWGSLRTGNAHILLK